MTSDALRRALTDPGDPPLPPLPGVAVELLDALDAPPRLAAHLRLVHDVARQLTAAFAEQFPLVPFDRQAVLFGAAIHDLGKIEHPEELSGPGSAHEEAGYQLLLRFGVPEERARFAVTHAAWHAPGVQLEDLLVSLADKVWKGKRVTDLEELVVDRLADITGQPRWQSFLDLDDVLAGLAADADRRLAFQAEHPVHG
ncbi:HD domain-containing protein [Micromonospora halotolerans]|uniref:HD domain-containing protein n=1 Tax=Micromonospora halotolerans TaxID=709879 RepID=A0ABY9ZVG0_9ACTN|nr:HD domain-containing protein [Micromonospora halotolerans]WNM38376.1 HD domain-containing protein [Micromonospora halotolerans]